MNHKPWIKPLQLKSGYKSLKAVQSLSSNDIQFSVTDIEWFLQWGMDSFLKYTAQVL